MQDGAGGAVRALGSVLWGLAAGGNPQPEDPKAHISPFRCCSLPSHPGRRHFSPVHQPLVQFRRSCRAWTGFGCDAAPKFDTLWSGFWFGLVWSGTLGIGKALRFLQKNWAFLESSLRFLGLSQNSDVASVLSAIAIFASKGCSWVTNCFLPARASALLWKFLVYSSLLDNKRHDNLL